MKLTLKLDWPAADARAIARALLGGYMTLTSDAVVTKCGGFSSLQVNMCPSDAERLGYAILDEVGP